MARHSGLSPSADAAVAWAAVLWRDYGGSVVGDGL